MKNSYKRKNIRVKQTVVLAWKKLYSSIKSLKSKLLTFVRKAYAIISVISTLSIFFGLVLYGWGKITSNNKSDNDLIMEQIRREVGTAEISSINIADIHGLGNNSIVVTAGEETSIDGQGKLLILDQVDNKILSEMNDPLGFSSSYKTTYSQSLYASGMGLYPSDISFVDLDDSAQTKEIVVNYTVWGCTYSACFPAVYRYSYDSTEYELFGTFPLPHYVNNKVYGIDGTISEWRAAYEKTALDGFVPDNIDAIMEPSVIGDNAREYCLPTYSDFCFYYWASSENKDVYNYLVVVYQKPDSEYFAVNVYFPSVQENKLQWGVMESIFDCNLRRGCNKQEVQAVLDQYADWKWKIK